MTDDHIYWHGKERKYKDLDPTLIPRTESLEDTLNRVKPLYENEIYHDLKAGRNVMVVAHTNSLRGIIRLIDNLDIKEIQVSYMCNITIIVYYMYTVYSCVYTILTYICMYYCIIIHILMPRILLELTIHIFLYTH